MLALYALYSCTRHEQLWQPGQATPIKLWRPARAIRIEFVQPGAPMPLLTLQSVL